MPRSDIDACFWPPHGKCNDGRGWKCACFVVGFEGWESVKGATEISAGVVEESASVGVAEKTKPATGRKYGLKF